jgi:hypothetical protein
MYEALQMLLAEKKALNEEKVEFQKLIMLYLTSQLNHYPIFVSILYYTPRLDLSSHLL